MRRHRIGVLTVQTRAGYLHGAAMHYVHQHEPMQLVFLTQDTTAKVPHLPEPVARAAVVVGFSEEEWSTVQMHGTVEVVNMKDPGYVKLVELYERKYPEMSELDEHDVFMVFRPEKWKYTEMKRVKS